MMFLFFFFFFFLHFSRTSHNYVLHDVSPISVLIIFVDLNFQGNVSNATLTRVYFLLVDVKGKMCPQYRDALAVGYLTIKLQILPGTNVLT